MMRILLGLFVAVLFLACTPPEDKAPAPVKSDAGVKKEEKKVKPKTTDAGKPPVKEDKPAPAAAKKK